MRPPSHPRNDWNVKELTRRLISVASLVAAAIDNSGVLSESQRARRT